MHGGVEKREENRKIMIPASPAAQTSTAPSNRLRLMRRISLVRNAEYEKEIQTAK
jgi:hypothetical protein